MHRYGRLALVVVGLVCCLAACSVGTILRSRAQESAFREHYVGKPFYTAFIVRPYKQGNDFLIDLTGRMTEVDYTAVRTDVQIPLGTPITITAIEREYLRARVEGFQEDFRILVSTEAGTAQELGQEVSALLAPQPPLATVRQAMRPFVARGEIRRGMSRREVHMSWGVPDKANILPGSTSVLEEWIYFDKGFHLFLKNGFVTNWQQM